MGFEQFAAGNFAAGNFAEARDFFYLAALFLGAGIGCILNRYRRKATTRFRNRTVTIGLCFFSGSAAALTAAIIFSNWMIFRETAVYLPIGIIVFLLTLAFRFPRAAGFPIFLISGVCLLLIGFNYLRFPVIDGSACLHLSREADGLLRIQPAPRRENGFSPNPAEASVGDHSALEFRGFCFSFPKIFPLVGGVSRGLIVETKNSDGESLYTDPRFRRGDKADFLRIHEWLLFYREVSGKLEIKNLPPGTDLTVFFDVDTLTFH